MKLIKAIGSGHSLERKVSISICLSVSLFFLLGACGKKEEPVVEEVIRPVKTMTVAAGLDAAGLTLPGTVRAAQRVELAFKEVGGRLIELPIAGREGQAVEQDDLLARIDPRDFETALRNVQGRLKEAIASLDLAKSEYARVKRIQEQDPGAISGADIDRKREAVNAMQGRIKSLRAEVAAARDKLSYTNLKAPFAGLIARRYVDNFQDVKPKQPILSLEDISSVEILIDVAESVMAIERAGGEDTLTSVAEFPTIPGKQFPLTLKEYATTADPATQTYQVVLEMPQPEGISILPGMTATVTVSRSQRAAADAPVIIPAIAVLAEPDGRSFVWIVSKDEMKVRKQEVTVGIISGAENINVTEGLEGGETIAVAGILKLQEGMTVRLWEKQE